MWTSAIQEGKEICDNILRKKGEEYSSWQRRRQYPKVKPVLPCLSGRNLQMTSKKNIVADRRPVLHRASQSRVQRITVTATRKMLRLTVISTKLVICIGFIQQSAISRLFYWEPTTVDMFICKAIWMSFASTSNAENHLFSASPGLLLYLVPC